MSVILGLAECDYPQWTVPEGHMVSGAVIILQLTEMATGDERMDVVTSANLGTFACRGLIASALEIERQDAWEGRM